MTSPNPRLNAYRPGLAAEHLRDTIKADRYSTGIAKTVIKGSLPLRRSPDPNAPLDTELLFGDTVTVYDDQSGWAWLQATSDDYVGYTPSEGLGNEQEPPTHYVTALRTYLFPEPDLKSPPLDLLSMASTVRIDVQDGTYSRIANGGWLYGKHLAPIGKFATNHCGIALRFLGTPYLWGGKTSIGLDCSGLTQVALALCGQSVARDTGMQEKTVGTPIAFSGDDSVLRKGDLVFWPGHVGIWIDAAHFVHANATDMMVAVAPLSHVAAYIKEATGDEICAVRRP